MNFKVTTEMINFYFNIYNEKYFNSTLPLPNFCIIHRSSVFGYFRYTPSNGVVCNPIIEISDKYNYTEDQLEDVLVHEMLHYYLAYTGKDKKCRHGKEFKKYADDLNLNYGLNIQKTYNPKYFEKYPSDNKFIRFLTKIFYGKKENEQPLI